MERDMAVEQTGRRTFMKIVGGGVILAAAGAAGVGGYAATRSIAPATAPWRAAGAADLVREDIRRWALSYAILAPNPHNMQPWVVDLSEPGVVVLYADPERRLPHTDPFDRQITIGLGCFLGILDMAAAERGYRAEIAPFPAGGRVEALGTSPVARIRFVEDASISPDPLFAQVLVRRSNKEPYDTSRTVPDDVAARVVAASTERAPDGISLDTLGVEARLDDDFNQVMRNLTWQGYEIEGLSSHLFGESVDVMRIGAAEVNANPDGIEIHGSMIEMLRMTGLISRDAMRDPDSTAFKQGGEMLRAACDTAMGQLWIVSPGNSRIEQLATGVAHVRANLAATAEGLGFHPNSQTMQEDPVFADLQLALYAALGVPDSETVQMLSRIGYGPQIGPTPRWALDTRLRA
jgi:hypothetical protein